MGKELTDEIEKLKSIYDEIVYNGNFSDRVKFRAGAESVLKVFITLANENNDYDLKSTIDKIKKSIDLIV